VPYKEVFEDLYKNQYMYVRTESGNITILSRISEIVDDTHIKINKDVPFTSSYAEIGQIRGNSLLYAFYNGPTESSIVNPNKVTVILDKATSNTTVNFDNAEGQLLIGTHTMASANVIGLVDDTYNSINPLISVASPPMTDISLSFVGTKDDVSRNYDEGPIGLVPNVTKEFFDTQRVVLSRSKEWTDKSGNSTLTVFADVVSTNSYVSPVVDSISQVLNFTSNMICTQNNLVGFQLQVADVNGTFNVGDSVQQGNSVMTYGTGEIIKIDDDIITISNIRNENGDLDGYFGSMDGFTRSSFVKVGDTNTNATITDAQRYGERLNNNYKYASRYISKNVILAEGQDAEDIRVFLTAYRPAGTNFKVYFRSKHREDPRKFSSLNWSMMGELTSSALLSSSANLNDYVELQYGLPRSREIFNNTCNCDVTSRLLNVVSTSEFQLGDYIYIKDNTPDSTNFLVRKVISVVDNNRLNIGKSPPFTSDNVSIGIIPSIDGINGTASTFIYTENNNIVRYVSRADKVYDGYKMFAIKIVPVSDNKVVIPRAQDMRAIALQI
jgi:hypothetical protein